MKTTRLAQFSELDTIKVHVPGSGTSIIHAGQGKAVHEYEVNTKGLPDISGSLKALSGEVYCFLFFCFFFFIDRCMSR